MEAAKETKSPVIIQAQPGSALNSLRAPAILYHLILAGSELLPGDSDRDAPGSRQQLRDMQIRYRAGIHQRDDGWGSLMPDGNSRLRL